MALSLIPAAKAAANLEVTAFSCNPSEIVANNQFSCTATVQNTGDASGTLNTATLYPDSNNWLENINYAETVNSAIGSGASAQVVFNNLKGKKSGYNGFSKIMIDDVTDTYVADNGIKVNVIDVIGIVTTSASSAANGAAVDVTGQATAGGNVNIVLSFSVSSGGCSIGNQPASATTNSMSNGQTTSHTWTVTMGSANCAYSVSAKATSNPSGTASKTDTTSGSITCSSNCAAVSTDTTTTATSGGGGGGGGGGAAAGETKTLPNIAAGAVGEVSFITESLAVTKIIINAKNAINGAQITITSSSKPSEADEPIVAGKGNVYKYISISKINVSDDNISKVTISFNVNKTWISDNNIDSAKIFLNRYNNAWEKYAATKISESSNYILYSAESPGLSVFAITGEKASAAAQQQEQQEQEQPPAAQCGNGIVESGEECDGTLIDTSCVSKGYKSGMLKCTNCRIDASKCVLTEIGGIAISKELADISILIVVIIFLIVIIAGIFYYHGRQVHKEIKYSFKAKK